MDGTAQGNPLLSDPQLVDGEPPQNVSSIANDPSHSAEAQAAAAAAEPASHLTGETARVLPPSELPVPHAPGSQPVPPNPYAFTLEPPTTRDAESIYDFDMKVMNASGQPWRARGSDISRWFNYGFDEFTWKRYCEYRKEMVKGIEAMVRFDHLTVIALLICRVCAETNPDGPATFHGSCITATPSNAENACPGGPRQRNGWRDAQHRWI